MPVGEMEETLPIHLCTFLSEDMGFIFCEPS